ncbi:MAG: hypothetical protein R3E86_04545 [Pseudomonadales bacterium]
MQSPTIVVTALIVAIGFAAGGYLAGQGFVEARALERSVEVKGLAEREVPADTAIWPVQILVAGDQLQPLLDQIETQSGQVSGFSPRRVSRRTRSASVRRTSPTVRRRTTATPMPASAIRSPRR